MSKNKEFNDQWFDALTRDRQALKDTLTRPDMKLWDGLISKYPTSAHFIYELLQNADDALATEAQFILRNDKLIFKHNGMRHFSISDPKLESIENDMENGRFGDINSITAIGASTKDKNKIGKFGIGFKSVFEYTNTPHIYDSNIQFKIENYIVPIRLHQDLSDRNSDETVFIIPFNKQDTQQIAYQKISQKLNSLDNPVLFLTHLKKITYTITHVDNEFNGKYEVDILDKREFPHDTQAELIQIHHNEINDKDNIWLFSRNTENNLKYSVGFWLDADGFLIPRAKDRAYCYFTTKEDTHLNFIVHAPFILTPERTNISSNDNHERAYNIEMIQRLAELAGDALLYFRDMSTPEHRYITDRIFDLIPIDESVFRNIDDSENISFKPFYTEIRKRFETEPLLPGTEHCVSKEHAYWASTAQIMELFSTEQLKEITGNSEAEWVLSQFGRESQLGIKIRKYVDGLIQDYFDDTTQSKNILNKIDCSFIEHQKITWLLKFYQWCSETGRRQKEALRKPIILNQNNEAVCPYNSNDEPLIFLPDNNMSGLQFVSDKLINNHELKDLIERKFNIKKPELWDYIKRNIIPKYNSYSTSAIPLNNHNEYQLLLRNFKLIFEYFVNECTEKYKRSFVSKLENVAFIPVKINQKYHRASPKILYLSDDSLKAYLKYCNKDCYCISIDDYKDILQSENSNFDLEKSLTEFLSLFNMDNNLNLFELFVNYQHEHDQCFKNFEQLKLLFPCNNNIVNDNILPHVKSSKAHRSEDRWSINRVYNLCEFILNIQENQSKEKSVILWNLLIHHSEILESINQKNCEYSYYYISNRAISFYSPDYYQLKTAKWIIDKNGNFVSAQSYNPTDYWSNDYYFKSLIDKSQLSPEYDLSSPGAQKLCEFLRIKEPPPAVIFAPSIINEPIPVEIDPEEADNIEEEEPETAEDQIKQLEKQLASKDEQLASKDEQLASKNAELERYKEKVAEFERQEEERRLRRERRQQRYQEKTYSNDLTSRISPPSNIDDMGETEDEDETETDTDIKPIEEDCLPRRIMRQVRHYVRESKPSENNSILTVKTNKANDEQIVDDDENDDCDEYIPTPVNYQKRIASAEQKTIQKIRELNRLDMLQIKAQQANKYTFEWFKALIELEAIQSDEANHNSRKVSISFGKAEREPKTERTLILKHPNKPIPLFMEELADITLTLYNGERPFSVVIEAASIRSFTLRVKLRSMDALKDINLNSITEAHIEAQSPAFLWEKLLNGYKTLQFKDDDNLQKSLPQNLEFVFGPPGTGKTTYLANNYLIPWMQSPHKVLVLTPTNKAADVIITRIMAIMGKDQSYTKWLVRFGTTSDEAIENTKILHDSSLNFGTLDKCVIVTTIARFPYDYCLDHGKRILLSEMNWDHIIIDEASMIPVANIVYPIFKSKPQKFIIAGDPFQIEPIASIDLWADENIYKMTELNSFSNPHTTPHQYSVKLLTKQYRSIPEIGNVFSNFKYNGIIEHHRKSHTQKPLNIDIEFDALNLIKFPVQRYESIYRCKRLNQSSNYQIYSALFTYEFVCFIARKLALRYINGEALFRIGVISPYRVQADLIAKLIASEKLPASIDILVGTIHSFQGDECDMIFAVFNPPENITPNSFVNRDNILNVSISRARDYLCIVMPDDETKDVEKLTKIKSIERLMHDSSKSVKIFHSNELETMMFNTPSFIEDNTFSTSHQSVNVYKEPEKIYEIRSEATAIDIQVHKANGSN